MDSEDQSHVERRWRGTGTLQEHTAYLRAHSELGRLEAERLELAAYLGHEAARLALGPERLEALPAPPPDLRDWVLKLERWGIEASVRAAVAAARLSAAANAGSGSSPRQSIAAAEALLSCPCDEHEKAARITWTQDAGWASEVAWAEISSEVAWDAHWRTSEERVRAAVTARLLPWALGEEGAARAWDARGTGGDLPPTCAGPRDGSRGSPVEDA